MVERGQRVWLAGVDWLRQTFGMGASDVTPAPRLASTESTEAESLDTDAAETDELDEALDESEVFDADTDAVEDDIDVEDDISDPDMALEYADASAPVARASLPARFVTFIRNVTVEGWLWVGVILLGAVLRFWGIGDKPLHHDESMHAFFSLSFARAPASYEYDPLLHGPVPVPRRRHLSTTCSLRHMALRRRRPGRQSLDQRRDHPHPARALWHRYRRAAPWPAPRVGTRWRADRRDCCSPSRPRSSTSRASCVRTSTSTSSCSRWWSAPCASRTTARPAG